MKKIFYIMAWVYPVTIFFQTINVGPGWLLDIGAELGFAACWGYFIKYVLDEIDKENKVSLNICIIAAGILALLIELLQFTTEMGLPIDNVRDSLAIIAGTIAAYYVPK